MIKRAWKTGRFSGFQGELPGMGGTGIGLRNSDQGTSQFGHDDPFEVGCGMGGAGVNKYLER